ncbi:MAG: hypothetical protein NXI19_00215 [Alphaproteobacteria bacterium]|nr:hypothetical protein [Alphaproteobacteria bacterium]
MRHVQPSHRSPEARPTVHFRRSYLTARVSGVDLCETMRVGILMASAVAAFAWVLMAIRV